MRGGAAHVEHELAQLVHRGVTRAVAVRQVQTPPGGAYRQREAKQVLRRHDVRTAREARGAIELLFYGIELI